MKLVLAAVIATMSLSLSGSLGHAAAPEVAKSSNAGSMNGGSMNGTCPFQGAFFSHPTIIPDQKALPATTRRVVKFFFGVKTGAWAIAYSIKGDARAKEAGQMKQFGRFTISPRDKNANEFIIQVYPPDYEGPFKASLSLPSGSLDGVKVVAKIVIRVQDKGLAVSVEQADSTTISLVAGDSFSMIPGDG